MRCKNLNFSIFILRWLTCFGVSFHHILGISMICSNKVDATNLFYCIKNNLHESTNIIQYQLQNDRKKGQALFL
jgi:hypothetical protein